MNDKLSEINWQECSGSLRFGISEEFSMYSFVLFDEEMVLYDSEVEGLYLVLKRIVESWSTND